MVVKRPDDRAKGSAMYASDTVLRTSRAIEAALPDGKENSTLSSVAGKFIWPPVLSLPCIVASLDPRKPFEITRTLYANDQ